MSPVKEESEPKWTLCEMAKEIPRNPLKGVENEAVTVKKVDDNLRGLGHYALLRKRI